MSAAQNAVWVTFSCKHWAPLKQDCLFSLKTFFLFSHEQSHQEQNRESLFVEQISEYLWFLFSQKKLKITWLWHFRLGHRGCIHNTLFPLSLTNGPNNLECYITERLAKDKHCRLLSSFFKLWKWNMKMKCCVYDSRLKLHRGKAWDLTGLNLIFASKGQWNAFLSVAPFRCYFCPYPQL